MESFFEVSFDSLPFKLQESVSRFKIVSIDSPEVQMQKQRFLIVCRELVRVCLGSVFLSSLIG